MDKPDQAARCLLYPHGIGVICDGDPLRLDSYTTNGHFFIYYGAVRKSSSIIDIKHLVGDVPIGFGLVPCLLRILTIIFGYG